MPKNKDEEKLIREALDRVQFALRGSLGHQAQALRVAEKRLKAVLGEVDGK